MRLSLSFFSSHVSEDEPNKYALLVESSRIADRNGFEAVWVPERHFDPFGGIFPNPALASLLVATATENVRVRAGSIVLPLNDPLRVAEDWSMVDNVSGGRVDLSFATGWNPNDFVLAPDNYADRVAVTFERIEVLKRLWRGEEHATRNGQGEPATVRTFPRPVQDEFGAWMTCTGPAPRFVEAGRMGLNVLTALISQSSEELASNIGAYRLAREQAGLDPEAGCVTLTLHTYIGESADEVGAVVREPLKTYLADSVELWKQRDPALGKLLERPGGLEFAFQRYFRTSGLFGTVEQGRLRIQELAEMGINEIACLVDFGLPADIVLSGVERLAGLVTTGKHR